MTLVTEHENVNLAVGELDLASSNLKSADI